VRRDGTTRVEVERRAGRLRVLRQPPPQARVSLPRRTRALIGSFPG
jgi:hypothetical protein